MTLVEVTIAIVVIAVIGVTVAGVAAALSNAYSSSDEYYRCVQTGRIIMLRMGDTLRRSRLVTDTSDTALMFWHEDTNGNRYINITELTMIGWDADTQYLLQYQLEFPEHWPQWRKNLFNGLVPIAIATMSAWPVQWYHTLWGKTTLLAENVSDFSVRVDTADPETQQVWLEMTVACGERSLTIRDSIRLRADWTDRLKKVGWFWTLEP